jgi:hypothetical protein
MEGNQYILKIIKQQITKFNMYFNCLNFLSFILNIEYYYFSNFKLMIEFYQMFMIYFNQYMDDFPTKNQTHHLVFKDLFCI